MSANKSPEKCSRSIFSSLMSKVIYALVIIGLFVYVCLALFPQSTFSSLFTFLPGQTSAESTATPTPQPTVEPTPAPTNTPAPTATPSPIPAPAFTGQSCIITDFSTGDILYSANPTLQIFPASTIKLLTAMIALDLADTDKSITLSRNVFYSIDYDVTSFHAPIGTTYCLEDWLNLLLIQSYADAANAIAEGTAGSISKFIDLMNQRISELGLENTSVDNTIGLDIGNNFHNMYSTAEDMLAITLEALKYPLIRDIISKPDYTTPDTPKRPSTEIQNTNPFLRIPEVYYSSSFSAIGGKTGSTNAAGNCLALLVQGMDEHKYVCVYYGGTDYDTMTREIIELLEYSIIMNQQ